MRHAARKNREQAEKAEKPGGGFISLKPEDYGYRGTPSQIVWALAGVSVPLMVVLATGMARGYSEAYPAPEAVMVWGFQVIVLTTLMLAAGGVVLGSLVASTREMGVAMLLMMAGAVSNGWWGWTQSIRQAGTMPMVFLLVMWAAMGLTFLARAPFRIKSKKK